MKNIISPICILFFVISCKQHVETVQPLNLQTEIIDSLSVEQLILKSSTASSQRFDKILDNYDQHVALYLVAYKKNNLIATLELSTLLKNALDIEKSLKTACENAELSWKQINRLSEIQNKMPQPSK